MGYLTDLIYFGQNSMNFFLELFYEAQSLLRRQILTGFQSFVLMFRKPSGLAEKTASQF